MIRRLFQSEAIKNTGNLARDLLAAENTFLAWTRTGLGFISLGVALEKVDALAAIPPTFLHLKYSKTKVAAGILVSSGTLCVAHGTHRYFSTMRELRRGMFRPNVIGINLVAAMSIALAFAGTLMVMESPAGEAKKSEEARV